MVKAKCEVLLLLDNCTAHHTNAHLSAVEMLFLPPNTAKLQLLVIAAADTLCMYFGSSKLKTFGSQLDGMEVVILKFALAKLVQGTLDCFFQRQ